MLVSEVNILGFNITCFVNYIDKDLSLQQMILIFNTYLNQLTMDYSKVFFNVEWENITYNTVANYFQDPKSESDTIEYKSFHPDGTLNEKLKAIYKTTCSFLNSAGGLLVWGSPAGIVLEGQQEKTFSGDLTPINEMLEQDNLINRLSDNITPLPEAIRAKILSNDNASCIVLIAVGISAYSPHQTGDKFYFRLDGQTRIAPYHYVEALFRKIKYPNLGGYIKFHNINSDGTYYHLNISVIIINHTGIQNEENVGFKLVCDHGTIIQPNQADRIHMEGHMLIIDDVIKLLHYGAASYTQVRLRIVPYEIIEQHNRMQLILMFGGKKSPQKQSTYTLNIELNPANINDLVVDRKENELSVDFAADKGTESEKVNNILGRND